MKLKKSIDKVKPYVPGKPIEEVQRERGLEHIYKLASNEIPFPPKYLTKVILPEMRRINRYPQADCFYLKKALARRFKVKPSQIVLGNGSDELIVLILRAIEENSGVIVGDPTFLIYEIQSNICGNPVIKVPFKNGRYDLSTMAKKIDKTIAVVFIANPDNPHGTYLSHHEIITFLKKVPKEVLVFLDEAYYEFAPAGDFPKSISLLKSYPNLIITRTFSKAYGLAGLRIGYGIMNENLAVMLNKIREPFNVNRVAQVAALAALQNKVFLKKVVSHVNREKLYFYREFKKLGLSFLESATNFILVKFDRPVAPLVRFLLERGVIVRDMSGWGMKNCLRVTVGFKKENRLFIKALRAYCIKQ